MTLMKNLVILLFLTVSTMASATSWYISPSGNDNNNGSISTPFFTLNKAWSVAKAGDIIYARGGLYKFNSRQNLTEKNGTASDTIRIWAYPGERPVFTKSSAFTTPSWPVSLIYVKADYIHLRGLEVAYFTQKTSTIWYGIAVQGSDHNKFERINSHHNGHGMVIRDESNHNLVLNCDFHHNFDPLTQGDAYGNADGLEVGYQSASMENTIRGCRMWRNSDDGIDLWQNNGNVIIDGCWSWYNGYREDGRSEGGDGGGFKFGSTTTQNGTEFKRTVRNSIAVYNRTRGFNQNGANVRFYLYNNIAWKNPYGFVFYAYNLPNVYRNNIVFDNSTENWNGQYSNAVKDHNSYDSGLPSSGPVASTADFLSLDTTGISKSRKTNGDLPDLNFMKLAPGSDLIDAGTNVGTKYAGSAPDLGPFETGFAPPAPAPPVTPVVPADTTKPAPPVVPADTTKPAAPEVPADTTKPAAPAVPADTTVSNPDPLPAPADPATEIAENNGRISIQPSNIKDFISIMNFKTGQETSVLKIYDFSGKLCQEIKLEKSNLPDNIPVTLVPGFYKALIATGGTIVHNQKLIVVK